MMKIILMNENTKKYQNINYYEDSKKKEYRSSPTF